MKIRLGDFHAKLGREYSFKPTIGNDSPHQDSNNNFVRIVHFATSNVELQTARFSCAEPFVNTRKLLLMGRFTRLITYCYVGYGIPVYLMYDLSGELTVLLITFQWLLKFGEIWQEVNKQQRSLMSKDLISGRYVSWRSGHSIRLRYKTGLRLWRT